MKQPRIEVIVCSILLVGLASFVITLVVRSRPGGGEEGAFGSPELRDTTTRQTPPKGGQPPALDASSSGRPGYPLDEQPFRSLSSAPPQPRLVDDPLMEPSEMRPLPTEGGLGRLDRPVKQVFPLSEAGKLMGSDWGREADVGVTHVYALPPEAQTVVRKTDVAPVTAPLSAAAKVMGNPSGNASDEPGRTKTAPIPPGSTRPPQ